MAKTKAIKIKRSPGDQLVQIVIYIFVGAFALITLLPFVYIVAGSFATERELTERAFFLFPRTISMNAYQYIFKTGDAIKGLKNSIFVTVVGVLINMVFSSTLAYPLSRPYFKGRKFFTNMVIVTMLFSGGMVPAYLVVANVLHLKDSFWALWLPGAGNPFNMIISRTIFRDFPQSWRRRPEWMAAMICRSSAGSSFRCPNRCWQASPCFMRLPTGILISMP